LSSNKPIVKYNTNGKKPLSNKTIKFDGNSLNKNSAVYINKSVLESLIEYNKMVSSSISPDNQTNTTDLSADLNTSSSNNNSPSLITTSPDSTNLTNSKGKLSKKVSNSNQIGQKNDEYDYDNKYDVYCYTSNDSGGGMSGVSFNVDNTSLDTSTNQQSHNQFGKKNVGNFSDAYKIVNNSSVNNPTVVNTLFENGEDVSLSVTPVESLTYSNTSITPPLASKSKSHQDKNAFSNHQSWVCLQHMKIFLIF
jgi:hypothetical protein